MAGGPLPNLHVWGNWNEAPPPQITSELLLSIAKESRPLIVIDPFRFAHSAEENDATEMAGIMQRLRCCAVCGSTVIVLHHLAKAEHSTSRGSSAIRDHCDIAWVQELNAETDLISLKGSKNRFGDRLNVTIRPNFEDATFAVVDSPEFVRRTDELEKIKTIICQNPGASQNKICDLAGLRKARVIRLLKDHNGRLWTAQSTPGKATLYFPKDAVPNFPEPPGTAGTGEERVSGSPVPTLKGGTVGTIPTHGNYPPGNYWEPPQEKTDNPKGKTLPSCPACGSFAIFREPEGGCTCLTCEQKV